MADHAMACLKGLHPCEDIYMGSGCYPLPHPFCLLSVRSICFQTSELYTCVDTITLVL